MAPVPSLNSNGCLTAAQAIDQTEYINQNPVVLYIYVHVASVSDCDPYKHAEENAIIFFLLLLILYNNI